MFSFFLPPRCLILPWVAWVGMGCEGGSSRFITNTFSEDPPDHHTHLADLQTPTNKELGGDELCFFDPHTAKDPRK